MKKYKIYGAWIKGTPTFIRTTSKKEAVRIFKILSAGDVVTHIWLSDFFCSHMAPKEA